MACQIIECKSNCTCCTKSLKIDSTNIHLVDGAMQITVPATTLSECQPVCIFLDQPFPTGFFNARITVLNGMTPIPVVSKCGRNIRIDTESAFNILRVRYFTDPSRFSFCQFGIRNTCC